MLIQDYPAAIALLQPMLDLEEDSRLPPSLFLALISLHLSSGSLLKARAILERLLEHPTAALAIKATGKGLVASSYGNWPLMQDTLKDITVDGLLGVGAVVINNLAVGLLNAGKLQEVRKGDSGSIGIVCSRNICRHRPWISCRPN